MLDVMILEKIYITSNIEINNVNIRNLTKWIEISVNIRNFTT